MSGASNVPLVSVIMPLYNGERYVAAAARSALSQTHANLELLVVDDGSTDRGVEAVQSLRDERVRVIRKENGGEASARNAGLDAASGQFVAWLDADDLCTPRRISTMLRAIETTGAAFAHCDMVLVDERERPLGLWQSSNLPADRVLPYLVRVGTPYNNPTMLIRADVVAGCRHDPSLRIGTDTDFVSQFAHRHPGVHIPEPLVLYRRHTASATAGVSAGDVEPQVERLLRRHPLEAIVPEAWFQRTGARARSLGESIVGLHLARRGLTSLAASRFRLAGTCLDGAPPEPVVVAIANLAGGDLSQAAAALGACDPTDDPVAANYRGELMALQGDLDSALRCFRQALDLAPDYGEPEVNVVAAGGARGLNPLTPYWRRFAR